MIRHLRREVAASQILLADACDEMSAWREMERSMAARTARIERWLVRERSRRFVAASYTLPDLREEISQLQRENRHLWLRNRQLVMDLEDRDTNSPEGIPPSWRQWRPRAWAFFGFTEDMESPPYSSGSEPSVFDETEEQAPPVSARPARRLRRRPGMIVS